MTIQSISRKLYADLFTTDTHISALQAWSLIEDALISTHNQALTQAASAVWAWTDGKERGDYDTFSAASAISGEIQALKVSIE